MAIIRRAGPSDLDVLLALIEEFCAIDGHPFDIERIRNGLGPLLADDTHGQVWLIAGHSGDAGGYGVITWGWSLESGGRDALLDELYVRDRGHGTGSTALGQMMHAAAAAGASRMFLETEARNTRVGDFYARLGFRAEDSMWMSKDLSAGTRGV